MPHDFTQDKFDIIMQAGQYCADFGGETAIKKSAIEKLQHIK